jgi:hypothetical protein
MPYTHNHSIKSFKHPMLTQSLNNVLQMSLVHTITPSHPSITLGARPFDHTYPTQTITQSYLSNIPSLYNHSITIFYYTLHTQSLHHILLSLWGHVLLTPNTLHTQSLNRIFQTYRAYTITQSHPSIVLAHTITQSHHSSFLTHTITQSHPSTVLCTHNHSIACIYCPLHTQSLYHILLFSNT